MKQEINGYRMLVMERTMDAFPFIIKLFLAADCIFNLKKKTFFYDNIFCCCRRLDSTMFTILFTILDTEQRNPG